MDVSSLLTGNNAALIDQLYHQWISDPGSVDSAWAELFSQWERDAGYTPPPTLPPAPSIFSARAVRAMVILKYAEEYTFGELAEMFGMTTSACKMRVSRARQRLQARFAADEK